MIGKGKQFLKTCRKAADSNTLPVHGLKGRKSNRGKMFDESISDDIFVYFETVSSFATPTATRLVRTETGNGLRDGEDGTLELEPSWSKWHLYSRFCYERGWRIKTDDIGVDKKERRTDGEYAPNQADEDSKEPEPICSWPRFWNFWNEHYYHLKLRKLTKDICGDCFIYFNRSKYDGSRNNTVIEFNVETGTVEAVPAEAEPDGDDNDDGDDEGGDETRENLIEKAGKHVKDAKAQRAYMEEKKEEAKEDENKNPAVQWSEMQDTLVADYCQNMELPYFGSDQPGDTYYFSPLSIYCFGISNLAKTPDHLHAYIYKDGDAKKGGNNVASLLVKYLKDKGWMDKSKGARKELTIIMDNCGGQNKNKMVLRLLAILVAGGYYKTARAHFLIVGHTKNSCDRRFNDFKRLYRNANIYTPSMFLDTLNASEYCECE
jgi:hypothetical protein